MDTNTSSKKQAGFVPWRPTPGPRGEVTIGAEYWDDDILRYKLGSPTPEQYLLLWNDGWLKFQGKYFGVKPFEKPEHYPTPEQVEEYLEWQVAETRKKDHLALMAEVAIKQRQQRLAVRVEPTPPTPEPPPAPKVPATTPTPTLNFDLDASARLFATLTGREKDVAEAYVKGRQLSGLAEGSLKVRAYEVASKVRIPPAGNQRDGRREALGRVRLRYQELLTAGEIVPKQSLTEKRVQILCATNRTLYEETGNKLVKPGKLLDRVAKDNPDGIERAAWSNFYYTKLNNQQRADILQSHHEVAVATSGQTPLKLEAPSQGPKATPVTSQTKIKPKTWVDPQILADYQKAAAELRSAGLEPSAPALSKKLSIREGFVQVFISVHPNFEKYE